MSSSKRTNKTNNITFNKCPLLVEIVDELAYENKKLKQMLSEIIGTINKIEEPSDLDTDSIEYIVRWSNTLETALSDIETITKFYAKSNIGATDYKVTA